MSTGAGRGLVVQGTFGSLLAGIGVWCASWGCGDGQSFCTIPSFGLPDSAQTLRLTGELGWKEVGHLRGLPCLRKGTNTSGEGVNLAFCARDAVAVAVVDGGHFVEVFAEGGQVVFLWRRMACVRFESLVQVEVEGDGGERVGEDFLVVFDWDYIAGSMSVSASCLCQICCLIDRVLTPLN